MQRNVKDKMIKGPGKGWHGDSEAHAKAGALGGSVERKKKRKKRKIKIRV